MLENFDSGWSPPSFENKATYSNIPPGEYTFLVKASDADKHWNKEPEKISFVITSPYWEKWWFTLSCSILMITIVMAIIKLRTQKIVQNNILLDKRVREQTAELVDQNREKEILLKEIHHRVKNNLQMVSSLLNLQADTIEDEKALSALRECRNRVQAMAIVHNKLYRTEHLSEIDFQSYAEQLYNLICFSYYIPGVDIKCDISGRGIFLDIDTLVPLGLILNELISNSFKHAFVNNKGRISIQLKKIAETKYEFIYSDDGKGVEMKPEKRSDSMGMMLLQLLGEQLEGEYSIESNKGFCYMIKFEVKK